MTDNNGYLPVDPDFIELIERNIQSRQRGKVHYFGMKMEIELAKGTALALIKKEDGEFLKTENELVRLDKIITAFGRPGPAFDAYDRYANACLTCENI